MTGLLESQPALLRQEVVLRQSMITTTLEQLTSDDVLTFNHMEKIISDVQGTLSVGLEQCTQGKMLKVKMVCGRFKAMTLDNLWCSICCQSHFTPTVNEIICQSLSLFNIIL